MPKSTVIADLSRKIAVLREERRACQSRLEEIDALFGSLGITVATAAGAVRRAGRPRKDAVAPAAEAATGKRSRRRRKRGSFKVTGEESVLAFIKEAGTPSTAEVNKHWREEGRGGKADNTLTRLVAEGRLKRLPKQEGERSGRYALP